MSCFKPRHDMITLDGINYLRLPLCEMIFHWAQQSSLEMPCCIRVRNAAGGSPDRNLGHQSNPGSVGHPSLCNRPCLYYAAGNCENGTDCGFCHLPHPKRPVRLDKRHREALKRTPFYELVAIMLPVLKEKASELREVDEARKKLSREAAVPSQTQLAADSGIVVASYPAGTSSLIELTETTGERMVHASVDGQVDAQQDSNSEANSCQHEVMELLDKLGDASMHLAPPGTMCVFDKKNYAGSETWDLPRGGSNPQLGELALANLLPGPVSRRSRPGSSAASTVSASESESRPSARKRDGIFGALQVMGLRPLLTMLNRIAPPQAHEARDLIEQVLQKLQERGYVDPAFQAMSTVSDGTHSSATHDLLRSQVRSCWTGSQYNSNLDSFYAKLLNARMPPQPHHIYEQGAGCAIPESGGCVLPQHHNRNFTMSQA